MTASEPQPKLWTRAEYQRLGQLGAFAPGERVELIEGTIVAMSPQNFAHTRSISHATLLLVRLFGDTHYVRAQCSLYLTASSEPEPDLALVRHELVDGPEVNDNPRSADLIIEVSEASLRFDQTTKLALYARAQIPEYWIVNLVSRLLEVYRHPLADDATYKTRIQLKPSESVAPSFAPDILVPVAKLF